MVTCVCARARACCIFTTCAAHSVQLSKSQSITMGKAEARAFCPHTGVGAYAHTQPSISTLLLCLKPYPYPHNCMHAYPCTCKNTHNGVDEYAQTCPSTCTLARTHNTTSWFMPLAHVQCTHLVELQLDWAHPRGQLLIQLLHAQQVPQHLPHTHESAWCVVTFRPDEKAHGKAGSPACMRAYAGPQLRHAQ